MLCSFTVAEVTGLDVARDSVDLVDFWTRVESEVVSAGQLGNKHTILSPVN